MNHRQTTPSRETDGTADPLAGGLVTRRWFVARAAGGLAALGLAGLVGYEWPHAVKRSNRDAVTGVQSFITRPDLMPSTVTVTSLLDDAAQASQYASPRFILVSPRSLTKVASQPGLMIVDRKGRLIWFQPITPTTPKGPYDFNLQSYKGQPVLTWWQGKPEPAGKMANSSYHTVAAVHAGNGLTVDLHELSLTSSGTALITAYDYTTGDLSAIGGPRPAT